MVGAPAEVVVAYLPKGRMKFAVVVDMCFDLNLIAQTDLFSVNFETRSLAKVVKWRTCFY